jgi:hypothetical protein
VIYGIEKSDHKNLTMVKTYPRSFGVIINQVFLGSKHDRRDRYIDSATNRAMANGQLTWLIQKGDIPLPNTQREAEKSFAFHFRETDNRLFKLHIHECPYDDIPGRFKIAQECNGISIYIFLSLK